MNEIWKPIPGFEGLYDASNLGRIRSTPGKTTSSARFEKRIWNSRVMKVKIQSHGNREDLRVELWKDNKHKTYLVARLVAMAFHGIPAKGLTVNHINGIASDNRPENLEWVTMKENHDHAHRTGLCASYESPIGLIDSENNMISFRSESQACNFLNRNHAYIYYRKKRGFETAVGTNGKEYKMISLADSYWRCSS